MKEKILKFLGLMRRANALQVGENNAGEAVRGGKAKLLLLASDASENAKKRAESFVGGRSCLLLELPFTKEELSAALGLGGSSMAARRPMSLRGLSGTGSLLSTGTLMAPVSALL